MAKSRMIRPQFFVNEALGELPPEARLLFIGLWTIADRDGRLKDRVKTIKAQLLPFDDADVDALINSLSTANVVTRYATKDGTRCIQIHNWEENQTIHPRETSFNLPSCDEAVPDPIKSQKSPGRARARLVPLEVEVKVEVEKEVKVKKEVKTNAELFDLFWSAYPKKKGKGAARKIWDRLRITEKLLEKILYALEQQRRSASWLKDGGQFIPFPQKWLNEQRWEDEAETPYDQQFAEGQDRASQSEARGKMALDIFNQMEASRGRKDSSDA